MKCTPCVMESVSKLLMAKGLKAFVRYQEEVASGEKRSLLDWGRDELIQAREIQPSYYAICDNLSSYFLFRTHSNGVYWGVSWVVGRSWRSFLVCCQTD